MSESEKLPERPSYYAIIPAIVRYDKSLSPNAKLLYGEITALLNFRNRCFASNAYFGRLYQISEVQVSRLIGQLIDAGHVISEMENTSKGSQRLIKLAVNINDNTHIVKKGKRGLNKKDKYNNQSNNNPSLINIKESCSFEEFWDLYGKKVGKKPCEKIWDGLKLEIRKIIFEKLPPWKNQFTNNVFYPNPETFLQDERWNDELIIVTNSTNSEYPNHWNQKFEDTLNGSKVSEYWKHLRSLGLKPDKDRFNKTIGWSKAS